MVLGTLDQSGGIYHLVPHALIHIFSHNCGERKYVNAFTAFRQFCKSKTEIALIVNNE